MKERASAQLRGVSALGGSALVFRVFALEAIDMPGVRPALWLTVLLGAALALPSILPLVKRVEKPFPDAASWSGRAACGLIFVLSIWDAAVSARLFSVLATYAALPDHAAYALSLPLIGVGTLVCLLGAGAMSAAGVVWRRVALALTAVALVAQVGSLQPGWVFPLLGTGPRDILVGAERAAGHMALAAVSVSLLGHGDRKASAGALRTLGWSALICAGAVLAFDMAVPAMPGEAAGRLFRLEMLADCGQSGFAAETIYVLLMAGGMLLVGFEMISACAALCLLLPRVPYDACAVACGALTALLSVGPLSGEAVALAAGPLIYPAALLAAGLKALPARKGEAA